MNERLLVYFNFLLISLILVPSALADWINLTGAQSAPNIAEIYVEDDHIRLVLEIYVGDLDKFVHILPGDFLKASRKERPPILQRTRCSTVSSLSRRMH